MALADLWLPILVSALFVFVVSSVLHMLIPIHKGDFAKLPGEADLLAAMRGQNVKPGSYMFPCAASMKEMGTPGHTEKMNQGPVGYMTVVPNGQMAMGKYLTWWFLYSILIGVFVGYIAAFSLAPGAHYMEVFRVTGTIAILGYATGNIVDSIWKGVSWTITAKFLFDGLMYGLVTAGTFGWLWPGV